MSHPGHASFVYCGHSWMYGALPADAVVAYEPVTNHGDGSHILFGNGDVRFISAPRAARLIAAASASTRPVSAASVK